jgi:hypothetical protein
VGLCEANGFGLPKLFQSFALNLSHLIILIKLSWNKSSKNLENATFGDDKAFSNFLLRQKVWFGRAHS